MATIKAGDTSAALSLKRCTEALNDIAAFAGKKLLLSFHPLAPTEVCAEKDDQVTS